VLYYVNSGPDRLPEVRALDLPPCCDALAQTHGQVRPGDRQVATLYSDGSGDDSVAVAPDGRLVYARAQVYQEFEIVQDLYSVDPKTGDERRLTRGVRARGIDVAPDGALIFLWRRPGGRTAIAELAPAGGEPRVIYEDASGEPVDNPRVSPDGARVAFVHHREGAWDVQIVNRDGTGLRDVTRDRALDRDPAWTADGRWLLFSSDRSGVYNVYAWNPQELRQVTNVVFGAFEPQPSPDGTQLALVTYSARGYDLARMPLQPETWRPVTAAPVEEQRPPPVLLTGEEVYPSRPYSPLETLRPHFWLPYANVDAYGATLGALTAGFDAVDRHEYAATAWWSLYGGEPGWDLLYTNHSFYPDLTLELTRDLETADPAGADPRGYYYERSTAGYLTASFPFSQVERSHALSFTYELANLSVDQNPLGVLTAPGRLAALSIGWSYSDAHRYVRSISAEDGQRFSVNFRVSDPALGSAFSFWQATASASKYFRVPWAMHQDLAVQASFGISRGDLSNRHTYFLGGFQQGDPVRAVLNPQNAPVTILRGYEIDAFAGEEYVLGTAEYRFPIWDVQAGAWTLPVYLRRLHGALFADVGDAFTAGRRDFRLHAGAGAELRAEVVLGWILPADLRFGCARGLETSPLAILDCYAALGGVF
ncbi:MAG TPA: LpqB family beta-propeller domain-containing protein, partial [Myxococcales bacterium]|nr:LpqB family beta-propeller domain-containing protein [Myxococcales bacterium]